MATESTAFDLSGYSWPYEGYHDTAEANQPTASQSTAHNPNDRNNTAVMDPRPDQ